MPLYEYRAIDGAGKVKKGKLDAASSKQAVSKLKSQKLHIVSISGSRKKLDFDSGGERKLFQRSKVSSKMITAFTRQLAVLVSTGIPYDKAFEILMEENDTSFQHIISDMKAKIVEGSSLADALNSQPTLFPKIYVAMVRAGEAGGSLGEVLDRLANMREENEALASKIQGAFIYPSIMAFLGAGIVVFMMTFILPKIIPIFQQFDMELPLPTKMVLHASNFMVAHWWQALIAIFILVYSGLKFVKTNKGEKMRDDLVLKTPILGKLIQKIIVYRFAQTLATLLLSGVELKQSLDIVKHVMGNRVYEDGFDQISTNITKKGMDLSYALRQSGLFPGSTIQMLRVGEESSSLEKMLDKIAGVMEIEVKRALDKGVSLLEPVIILGMALMVGFIVLAVMLPMFKMNQLI